MQQKLAEAYHEEEKACQSKKVHILLAVSKMKERKRILEIQAEHCKTNRLDLYYQWKEGRIVKEEYSIRKDELTKELVDELIERIDVYGDDRVEIKWKFNVQV